MKLKKLNKIKLHTMTTLYGAPGSGKAEWVDNHIHTPIGVRRFGDLEVGDFVFDRFGKPTKVIGVFPQGDLEAYKVTLNDGRSVICNNEHLWAILTTRNNLKVKTLQEIIDEGYYYVDSKGSKHSTQSIPTHSWVMYEEKLVETPPYVLGAFIANGSLTSKYLTLTSNDEFVVAKVAELMGYTYKKNSDKKYNWYFYKEGKLVKTNDVNLYGNNGKYSHEKFIPEEYLINSKEVRYQLLQGLMDNDGSVGSPINGGKLSYSTVSKQLAEGIERLYGSLGYGYGRSVDKREGKNTVYNILPKVPNKEKKLCVTLPRKLERTLAVENNEIRKDFKRVGIKSIEKLNKKLPMMCIKVDNQEELYLSNDFVVTHNTSFTNSLPGSVLIIDTDRGLASVEQDERFSVAECTSWEDVIEALTYAKDFDSIAIDHFTNVQELCYKDIMETNNVKKMLINHYGEASTRLKALVDELVDLSYQGKNVYVICQEKNVNIEDVVDENVPSQTIPNLMDSVSKYITASSRIIGHTERVTKSKVVKGEKKVKDFYQVRLAGNPIYTLKVTRKPGLVIPDTMVNPTWEAVVGLTDGTTQEKLKGDKE
jgi:hypothetical protein|nr:MAG TPA: DNA packaging protein [Caudoviricetes sp.]